MNWLLLLHITAMLCWCGSLLYLPAFISAGGVQKDTISEKDIIKISKILFTLIVTPCALITIISGTLVFIVMRTTDFWLILKLTLVTGLVICHTLNGWLIFKKKNMSYQILKACCTLVGTSSLLLIIGILWIVLTKPTLVGLI